MNLALWFAAFKKKRPAAKLNMQAIRATLKKAAVPVLLSWLLWWSGTGVAQELVHFPSWEDNGAGQAATVLNGYLYRPAGPEPYPAIVGLHGCSGMFIRGTSTITALYRAWAAELTRAGFVFLLVDSLGPRHHSEMCSVHGFELDIYRRRPRDAYGALAFLQAQPFVRGDRIGLAGWSQGGGAALFAIAAPSRLRPPSAPGIDFRAAVAFYPGSCNEERQGATWMPTVPLMVLIGANDVWTPAPPCQALLNTAIARGARIETLIYPGAYHGFDAPNVTQRELPEYRTRAGVVPIVGTEAAARQDAIARVPAFFARYLGN